MLSKPWIGDLVYVDKPTYKGFARISGIHNAGMATTYYLTAGPFTGRDVIEATESEIHNQLPGSFSEKRSFANGSFIVSLRGGKS